MVRLYAHAIKAAITAAWTKLSGDRRQDSAIIAICSCCLRPGCHNIIVIVAVFGVQPRVRQVARPPDTGSLRGDLPRLGELTSEQVWRRDPARCIGDEI
jgi:hypothetical protein